VLLQASCVAIAGRAVLIMGQPGSGKSSLALALIDRGAVLVGDDGVLLEARGERLYASPPPNTAGLLEVRNVGLIKYPTVTGVPVNLVLQLDRSAQRFIDTAALARLCDRTVPQVTLWPDSPVLALRAEAALAMYGLA
jgi:serine kinase of HPr protein (carbohydrate metabolism regulator)